MPVQRVQTPRGTASAPRRATACASVHPSYRFRRPSVAWEATIRRENLGCLPRRGPEAPTPRPQTIGNCPLAAGEGGRGQGIAAVVLQAKPRQARATAREEESNQDTRPLHRRATSCTRSMLLPQIRLASSSRRCRPWPQPRLLTHRPAISNSRGRALGCVQRQNSRAFLARSLMRRPSTLLPRQSVPTLRTPLRQSRQSISVQVALLPLALRSQSSGNKSRKSNSNSSNPGTSRISFWGLRGNRPSLLLSMWTPINKARAEGETEIRCSRPHPRSMGPARRVFPKREAHLRCHQRTSHRRPFPTMSFLPRFPLTCQWPESQLHQRASHQSATFARDPSPTSHRLRRQRALLTSK